MQRSYPSPPPVIPVLLLALVTAAALAQTTSLVASIGGETRTLQIQTRYIQETPYTSLTESVRLLGGTTRLFPNSVQIRLAQTTAVALFNHTRINTPQKSFSLQEPIVRIEDDVFIAIIDLPTFFSGAFQIAVREGLDDAILGPQEDTVGVSELDIVPPTPINTRLSNTFENTQPPAILDTDLFDVIVIDPGHGGSDSGYEGRQGLLEEDVTLALAQALRHALKQKTHLKSFLTRADDRSLNLRERVNAANQLQGDLIISIHAGVSTTNRTRGIQIFYPKAQRRSDQTQRLGPGGLSARQASAEHEARSKKFAAAVQRNIEAARIADSGDILGAPLRILRDTTIPGFLIEIGFLSNPAEEALLNTEAYRQKIASAIADGILEALLTNTSSTSLP